MLHRLQRKQGNKESRRVASVKILYLSWYFGGLSGVYRSIIHHGESLGRPNRRITQRCSSQAARRDDAKAKEMTRAVCAER
jgi:hypothetical protein